MVSMVLFIAIFYAFLKDSNWGWWLNWVAICASIVLGIIFGFAAPKLKKPYGACLLAFWAGYTTGTMLNNSVTYLSGSATLLWIVNLTIATAFSITAYFFFDKAIIFSTSMVGSYMVIRGVSLFFGGFPNEYMLLKMIQTGKITNIDPVFYAYLGGVLAMTTLCYFWQYRRYNK